MMLQKKKNFGDDQICKNKSDIAALEITEGWKRKVKLDLR